MTSLEVPVIDLADPLSAVAIKRACREWGFFQIVGHDIGPELRESVQHAAREFFAQSGSQKNLIRRSAENPWGFYDSELTKNVQDWKEIIDIGRSQGTEIAQWPSEPKQFREVMERFTNAARNLAWQITKIILESLGDTTCRELQGFSEDTSFLRLNYYPACPNPAPEDLPLSIPADESTGRLGISHHTDAGALTVLQQVGPEGLQVLRDNNWYRVRVLPDALVINIGDVAQVWSNDQYPAPLHRVLANQHKERYSAAYFFNPAYDYSYAPLRGEEAPRYRPINWREFRSGRAAGDYADQGDEIQIADYLIG